MSLHNFLSQGEVFRFWTPKQNPSSWSFKSCLVAPRQEFITFEAEATEWLAIVLLQDTVELDRYEVHLGVPDGTRQKSYIYGTMVCLVPAVHHILMTQCSTGAPVKKFMSNTVPSSHQIFFQDGTKYDEQDTPDILGHGGISSFWISWYENILTVGYGHSKDAGPVLLKLPNSMARQVNGLSFASPSSDAYWQIPRTLGRSFKPEQV